MTSTVRLSPLSEITGRPVEAIRNIQKADNAPWYEEDFPESPQRRYSAYHALGLILAEMLMAQGCTVALSGEVLRAHKVALNLFLDEVENSNPITPRFVLALQTAIEDEWTGPRWESTILSGSGTMEEVQAYIAKALSRVGNVMTTRKGRTKERIIGGPWVATASIPEAYRLLKQRAKAAGYLIEGRDIFKIASDEA